MDNNALFILFQQIAQEQGFTLLEMEERFKKHYYPVDKSQGDRCVDDRKRKTALDNAYLYNKGNYNGRQFPGGSFGILGALRVAAGLDEAKAREVLLQVYKQQDYKIGDHIDDQHGHINDPEELKTRNKGCGNQDKIREQAIEIYSQLVRPEVIDKRFSWLRENNGYLPVLTGNHKAEKAAINLIAGTTYNTEAAVTAGDDLFNADLGAVPELAKLFYQALEQKLTNEEKFTEKFVGAVITDYLQTLKALSPIRQIQYRK